MIDLTTILSLLAPILLLFVGDRVLRWRFARSRHSIAQQPPTSAATGDVIAPRPSTTTAEAERRTDERKVA